MLIAGHECAFISKYKITDTDPTGFEYKKVWDKAPVQGMDSDCSKFIVGNGDIILHDKEKSCTQIYR